jgi:hypothetical protein
MRTFVGEDYVLHCGVDNSSAGHKTSRRHPFFDELRVNASVCVGEFLISRRDCMPFNQRLYHGDTTVLMAEIRAHLTRAVEEPSIQREHEREMDERRVPRRFCSGLLFDLPKEDAVVDIKRPAVSLPMRDAEQDRGLLARVTIESWVEPDAPQSAFSDDAY